jgi:hypothetical protein
MIRIIIFSICCFLLSNNANAQEDETTKTLFGSETNIGFGWGGEIKFNSIQNKIGSLIGFYGGALVNKSLLFGAAIGANFGHPTVNYSYLGLLAQYSYKPQEVFNPSGQVLIALASTKDYERPKSSLMDNFLNTNGANFYFVEPGINLEINLSKSVRLVPGLSYRFAFGLDESSEHVAITNVTSKDMSGLNINIGVKIGKY